MTELDDGIEAVHLMTEEGCKISINGQGHLPCSEHPRGRCKDCDAVLAGKADVDAHLKETFTGSGSSHSVEIVNQTPAEKRENRIRIEIDSSLDGLFDDLMRFVERGEFTEEEIREQLGFFELTEGWEAYCGEDGS